MRLFDAGRIKKVMEFLKVPDNEPIEHRMVTNAIEKAQKRVEARNFGIRKNVLEYDDVMNSQRKAVYGLRDRVLLGDGIHELVLEAVDDVVGKQVDEHMPEGVNPEEFEPADLLKAIEAHFNMTGLRFPGEHGTDYKEICGDLGKQIKAHYVAREQGIVDALIRASEAHGQSMTKETALERWRFFERERYLRSVDTLWKHHLKVMESLREGIHLESYGQKDPKMEYKKQGFALFEMMVDKIKENVTETLFRAQGPSEEEIAAIRKRREEEEQKLILGRMGEGGERPQAKPAQPGGGEQRVVHQGGTYLRTMVKVGRNDPCPCGSGKKFKKCHEGREHELQAIGGAGGGAPPPPVARA
ncbi:MAG: SEC-C domain-containing protein [Deltaproteobacteria bacterium]|nr:SEC-C domain-containing protein [Deltaproteobacteria bacterium]